MFQSKRNIISILLKQRQQWFVINVIIRRVFRMNKHSERWVLQIIKDIDEPFTSQNVKSALLDKHGTAYIPTTHGLGQFLGKVCIVVGKHNGSFLYKVRVNED
tara:strand:- start:143 stop:451 length:309 start_codon:yes stop_codon:yes gene_type:complete